MYSFEDTNFRIPSMIPPVHDRFGCKPGSTSLAQRSRVSISFSNAGMRALAHPARSWSGILVTGRAEPFAVCVRLHVMARRQVGGADWRGPGRASRNSRVNSAQSLCVCVCRSLATHGVFCLSLRLIVAARGDAEAQLRCDAFSR